ncbi:MAG: methyltransferase domain-containing protein [Alphaproteobacteria bacterium]|nr:methyltransferase domain-containing protein [Alphaproteobacteria bacterium]MBV9376151.1 methyltransferase domain-containing protein [Alphaproteobacteria bacterium]
MALLPTDPPAHSALWPEGFAGSELALARRIDAAAIAAVTALYREILPPGGAILDLVSGWVSHLPPEIPYSRVVGVGLDGRELAENPFLDEWIVQDLNCDPHLPFANAEFDGAAICVAVQHLRRPCEVIREAGRVLKPGAPLIVTFSNRCVPTPAIGCWCLLDDAGHLCLIAQHFVQAGNWGDVRCVDRTPPGGGDPLYAVIGRSLGAAPAIAAD